MFSIDFDTEENKRSSRVDESQRVERSGVREMFKPRKHFDKVKSLGIMGLKVGNRL